MSAGDILAQVRITEVWQALGGGPLRYGRGCAFWRNGDGHNVSLSDTKGVWFDHARDEGGGILDLIGTVHGSSRAEALAWLADYAGVSLDRNTTESRQQWRKKREEIQAAQEWGLAAEALAETVLEDLEAGDPERANLTRLLFIIRGGGAEFVSEYRHWLTDRPDLTVAVRQAGVNAVRRRDVGLKALISQWGESAEAA